MRFWQISILFLFFSCAKITELKPEISRSLVVVECVLTNDYTQHLKLSLSGVDISDATLILQKAEVSVTDLLFNRKYLFNYSETEGEWVSKFKMEDERQYRLMVKIPGFNEITAVTTTPKPYRIVTKKGFKYYPEGSQTPEYIYANGDLAPPLEQGLSIETKSLPSGPTWIYAEDDDYILNQFGMVRYIATSLLSVDHFNQIDRLYTSEDYVDYSIIGPGDYLRYYKVEGQPYHYYYLRIPSEEDSPRFAKDNDEYFSLAGSFSGQYYQNHRIGLNLFSSAKLIIMSVSPEYDRYLKDICSYRFHKEYYSEYDLLLSRQNVYTNINNGLGIFGAKCCDRVYWENRACLKKPFFNFYATHNDLSL